jgi:ABC-type sugar transport system ATPase subunit
MASVHLIGVGKQYERGRELAVKDVTLEIADGEFFVLLGPSGCGKSTLLRMIGGVEEATGGEIWLDGRLVNYEPPGKRNVAMVFQNYALYPHMSVKRNMEFPLRMNKVPANERRTVVDQAAASLELNELMSRKVSELSGGQQQRVAVGRAIVRQPAVLLMDEPLSNLDALLRVQTREQLLKLHREVGTTTVYVTHDQVEAMTMGDRIGVMNEGQLVQVGSPDEVYHEPADRFVAGFLGSPPMNFVLGDVNTEEGRSLFHSDGLRVDLTDLIRDREVRDGAIGGRMTLGVRPEDVSLQTDGGRWEVDLVENLGADRIILATAGADILRIRASNNLRIREGQKLDLEISPHVVHVFDDSGQNVSRRSSPPATDAEISRKR